MASNPVHVYTDMCADLFHVGHVNLLKQCKSLYPSVYLIVGIHNDKTIESYKRSPVCSMFERMEVLKSCKYVDKIIPDSPLTITADFMTEHNIDLIVHGDNIPVDERDKMYGYAQSIGKYREVPRYNGISTTEIIQRCRNKQ